MINFLKQAKKFKPNNKAANIYKIEPISGDLEFSFITHDGLAVYSCPIPADGVVNGVAYTCNAPALNDLLKITKKIESVNIVDDVLIVNNSFKVKLEPAPAGISFSELEPDAQILLNNQNIDDIKNVAAAAATDELGILQHVYFDFKNAKAVATDGNRAHFVNIAATDADNVLINAKIFNKSIFKKFDILKGQNSVIVKTDIVNFYQNLVDGVFPKYAQLIPFLSDDYACLNIDNFLIKKIKDIPKRFLDYIIFDFEAKKIEYNLNDNNILLDCDFDFVGESPNYNRIGLNRGFLLDLFKLGGRLCVHKTQNLACCVICNDDNVQGLLMPIQLRR